MKDPKKNKKQVIPYSAREEIANVLSHGLGAVLSLIGLIFLILEGLRNNSPIQVLSYTIFGLSLVALYSASSIYHFVKSENAKAIFKKIDHICIYYLIAGSYTPFLLLSVSGATSYVLFITVWSMAVIGTIYKLFEKKKNIYISVSFYLIMGWLIIFAKEQMLQNLSEGTFELLLVGGLFYTLGVPFYLMKKTPFTHALWHLMVLGGSIFHFFAVKGTAI